MDVGELPPCVVAALDTPEVLEYRRAYRYYRSGEARGSCDAWLRTWAPTY